jgi:hypothetical protein
VIVMPRSTALHILVSVRSLLSTVLQIKDLLFTTRSILSKSVSELGQRLDQTWTTIPDHSPDVSLLDQQHPWKCAGRGEVMVAHHVSLETRDVVEPLALIQAALLVSAE